MTSSLVDRRWLLAAVAGFSVMVSLIYAVVAEPDALRVMLAENGPVEVMSAILHFAALALGIFLMARLRRTRGILGMIAVAAFLFGIRELDWHKAFTTHGIFSTKLYAYDTVPLAEKLIGGGLLLTLLVLCVVFALASRLDFRRLKAARSPALWSMVILFVTLVVLKLVDGAPRMMADAGMALSQGAVNMLMAVEEIGEMFLPVMIIALIVQIVRTPVEPVQAAELRAAPAGS